MKYQIVKLEVHGDRALFTQPPSGAEPVSYPFPTPSAVRNIIQAVFWKPEINWVIDRIHVLGQHDFVTLCKNEVNHKIPNSIAKIGSIDPNEHRQQKRYHILQARDEKVGLRYGIEAHFEFTDKYWKENKEANAPKYTDQFNRHAKSGRCKWQPYFGIREFPAYFEFVDADSDFSRSPISESMSPFPMFYDFEFDPKIYQGTYGKRKQAMFYAEMKNGIVDVAEGKRNFDLENQ